MGHIAKANGLWFYVYSNASGAILDRQQALPYAYVYLALSTENGGIIYSNYTVWNYSSGEAPTQGLRIQYRVDSQSPMGMNYILQFSCFSDLPFEATIEIWIYSYSLHNYAWLQTIAGVAVIIAGIYIHKRTLSK